MGGKEVGDPLYSTIAIPEELVPVVDHPLVQRLRWIKQLQTVHWVYPSATHTRFEHSLGVMHLAGIFAEALLANGLDEDRKYAKLLAMLGGLLHDIGHGPFSHTFDETVRKVFKPGRNHEVFGHKLILSTDLSDVIEKHTGIEAEDVVKFLKAEMEPLSYTVVNRIYPADILDYINRDRLHTNVDVAFVKRERLIFNTLVEDDRLKLRAKALDTLKTLLISRRDLFTKVYFHKTSLIIDKLVRRILSALHSRYAEALEKALEGDYSGFLELTDDNVIWDAYRDGSLRNLALALLSRKLPLKCIYRREFKPPADRMVDAFTTGIKKNIEDVLKDLGVEDAEVDLRRLKTIPDNPYDQVKRIPLDRGHAEYSDVLPDGSLLYLYLRVYVPRGIKVDEEKIVREIIKVLEEEGEKVGVTMRALSYVFIRLFRSNFIMSGRKHGLVLLAFVLLLVIASSPTSEVAFAVTGSGSVSVTLPAYVSIHMINSVIDFGTIDMASVQTVTIGTTTYFVLDSENDATNAPAKISRDEYDTNVLAIYYISDISASVTSGSTGYSFGPHNVFIKRDTTRNDYGYYTPGLIEVTLQDAGSSFTPTLPSGYTEIAQATYSTYVRGSTDGNTRNPSSVTFYIVLAQDSNGNKYLFVDDDTDFTDSPTDTTSPVYYTSLHQIQTIYENPYALVGTAFPAGSGDQVTLAQAATAPADESVSSTVMGFYVLLMIPKGINAVSVTRTITITGEEV